jgi:hypothetical protein
MAEICSLHHSILEKEAGMSAGTQLEQEMVRRHAEILQVIFEFLPMGVMVADLEGRLLTTFRRKNELSEIGSAT